MKKRVTAWILLLVATTITIFLTIKDGENVATATCLGAYASSLVGLLALKTIKSDCLYYSILIFIFCASPLGSVVNLYRKMDSYDKLVHLASGILIAALGVVIVEFLLRKLGFLENDLKRLRLVIILFGFLAASAAAGIWEIFEYIADKLAGGTMQRGMVDTVTDMIAGNLGGLFYCIFISLKAKFSSKKC